MRRLQLPAYKSALRQVKLCNESFIEHESWLHNYSLGDCIITAIFHKKC